MENNTPLELYSVAYDEGNYKQIPYLVFFKEEQAREALSLLNELSVKVDFYLYKYTPLIDKPKKDKHLVNFIQLSEQRLNDLKTGGKL